MSKQKRDRKTLALSKEGQAVAMKQRAIEGLSLEVLADVTMISVSTLKRFFRGDNVDPSTFHQCLQGLKVELKDEYIRSDMTIHASIHAPAYPIFSKRIVMTVVFTEDKRSEVELLLRLLQQALSDIEVSYHDSDPGVFVRVKFKDDYERIHADLAINQLEKLCVSIKTSSDSLE